MSAMVFDSMTNASIPAPASNPNEFAKKKKANRTAKLKQCKLDARRDQWLSQVKNNSVKEESNNAGVVNAPPRNVRDGENLGISSTRDENTRSNHYSDIESPSNSLTSHTSSVLGGNDSGTHFTGSSRSNSSSSGQSSGGSLSDEECLDDWEAIADAIAAAELKQVNCSPNVQQLADPENIYKSNPMHRTNKNPAKLDHSANSRAWRPDDSFRPQSLPNLFKQRTFPMNSDRYYGRGGTVWQRKAVISHPTSCPICCEELDSTDSSFLPCPCGFRLCLFCHKRILEGDGRCPGCRKPYSLDGYSTKF